MSTGTNVAPSPRARSSVASQASAEAASPSKIRSASRGIPSTGRGGAAPARGAGPGRENGSSGSTPAITAQAAAASSTVSAKTDTQSSVRHAGTTPRVGTSPSEGFSPTMLFKAAGTRPEPAVSVPSAKETSPRATATAEPDDDPPGTTAGSNGLRGGG